MEVSNEIKEDIRKTQSDLKNAIRVHQMWVARLQDDENNLNLKTKVREAEKDIIVISHNQKRVVDRLRKELELYQQRLKASNKLVNVENDTQYVAQQLRDHQLQYKNKNRSVSLLKPSVLNEIHIKTENSNGDAKQINELSDSDNDIKSSNEKENSNHSEDDKDRYPRNYQSIQNTVHDRRNNFANALNKVKESLISGVKLQQDNEWANRQHSDSDSSRELPENDISPSPSPPPLPQNGEQVTQEIFLRLIGLVTPHQKEIIEKERCENRKRSSTSTNKSEYMYGSFDSGSKRKKYNQFPYLQSHSDPPQTRSAKLKKQQKPSENSREGSPSGSSSEANTSSKAYSTVQGPAWLCALPPGLTVQPVYSKKVCHGCGRNDVPSLLVSCTQCGVRLHTGCGADGQCTNCQADLPDPTHAPVSPHHDADLYSDKLVERKRLQERNIQLCIELRKLEARASSLKDAMQDHHIERRDLLQDQIKTQRQLQKLLAFINHFKETSISIRPKTLSENGSEITKSLNKTNEINETNG